MRADRAAAYVGMSKSEFLKLVDAGVMPKPLKIGAMSIWDRLALDMAVEDLTEQSEQEGQNTFDLALRGKP
jgi:predicted DNA-binding transcriptional regulator AlpA